MALEERRIRQRACQRRFRTDHFRFEPQAQAHAVRTDVFGKTAQAGVAETVGGSLPFADHVPPAAVRAVVPAGVDAENIRANACRAFDQRQFLLNTWVTEQRVHVIVIDNETLRTLELLGTTQFAGFGNAQCATLQRHFGDGLLPIAGRDGERHGNRLEIIAFTKVGEPAVILIFRAECTDVQTGIILTDLPLPRAIMLNLPHHGEVAGAAHGTFDLYDTGRLMHPCAPCGGGAHGESRAGLAWIDFLVAVAHLGVSQRADAPIVFHGPGSVAPENIRTMDFAAVDAHGNGQVQRRHRFNRQLFGGLQARVRAHCGKIRERFEHGGDHQSLMRVGTNRYRRGIRSRGSRIALTGGRLEFAAFRLKIGIRRELRDLQTERIGGTLPRFGRERGNEA